MVSVVIPSRRERYLDNTLREVLGKAHGEVEVIVTLDGADAKRMDGVTYIYNEKPKGMRTAINQAVAEATGEYLIKMDAHCMLDDGYDEKLIAEHHDNWVQVPRRKRLDVRKWELINDGRPDIDYMYLTSDLMGRICGHANRREDLKKILVDKIETFQGSFYFMRRDYFHKLGLLDDVNFNGSGNEAQEVTFKVLRDGGSLMVNKKTWYAHGRMWRYYATDRSKSRAYIKLLAEQCGYKSN